MNYFSGGHRRHRTRDPLVLMAVRYASGSSAYIRVTPEEAVSPLLRKSSRRSTFALMALAPKPSTLPSPRRLHSSHSGSPEFLDAEHPARSDLPRGVVLSHEDIMLLRKREQETSSEAAIIGRLLLVLGMVLALLAAALRHNGLLASG
jgi:hypothetical protein